MAKTKQKTAQKDKYKVPCIVLGSIVVLLSAALAFVSFSTHLENAENKEYIALKDHLLEQHIEMLYGRENRVCQMEKHGLSKDNDLYVRFWCQDYDAESHEPITGKEYNTLYFQHPTDNGGWAEALGD